MKTTTEMNLVPIGELIPYINNARTHSLEQINKIWASPRDGKIYQYGEVAANE